MMGEKYFWGSADGERPSTKNASRETRRRHLQLTTSNACQSAHIHSTRSRVEFKVARDSSTNRDRRVCKHHELMIPQNGKRLISFSQDRREIHRALNRGHRKRPMKIAAV